MGKPRPKVEVMRYLKSKQYTDAKDFEGEYESVVMIAKGQSTRTNLYPSVIIIFLFSSQLGLIKKVDEFELIPF